MKSMKEKKASNFLIFAKWALRYIQVIQKLDVRIESDYGIIYWRDGNRHDHSLDNVLFLHICDALVVMASGSNRVLRKMNLLDSLTKSEVAFVRGNVDFFWIVNGRFADYSGTPITMAPLEDWIDSTNEFGGLDFQIRQGRKIQLYNKSQVFAAFQKYLRLSPEKKM